MSEDLKKALAGICIAFVLLMFYGTKFIIGSEEQKQIRAIEKAKQQAAYQALTPEQKLRQKVKGITDLKLGETVDGIETLQLTITQKFPSSNTWFLMTIEDYTRAAFSAYPEIELLDIKVNLSTHDSYGQPTELPGLLYEMDRQTYQKINWNNFNLDNLPNIAERWTPLHHQLKIE